MMKFACGHDALTYIVKEFLAGNRGPHVFEVKIPYMDLVLEDLAMTMYDWRKARAYVNPIKRLTYNIVMKPTMRLMPYDLMRWYGSHIYDKEKPLRVYVDYIDHRGIWPELQKAVGIPVPLIQGEYHDRPNGHHHFFKLTLK